MATDPKNLGFKAWAYFAVALIAATVVGFELGSSSWRAQANDWKNQSNEWKAKATENVVYADRWEAEAKRALDLAGRCVTPLPQAN